MRNTTKKTTTLKKAVLYQARGASYHKFIYPFCKIPVSKWINILIKPQ